MIPLGDAVQGQCFEGPLTASSRLPTAASGARKGTRTYVSLEARAEGADLTALRQDRRQAVHTLVVLPGVRGLKSPPLLPAFTLRTTTNYVGRSSEFIKDFAGSLSPVSTLLLRL